MAGNSLRELFSQRILKWLLWEGALVLERAADADEVQHILAVVLQESFQRALVVFNPVLFPQPRRIRAHNPRQLALDAELRFDLFQAALPTNLLADKAEIDGLEAGAQIHA